MNAYERIINVAKSIDLDNIDFESNTGVHSTIIEKQRTYAWIRLNIREELSDLVNGDIIEIVYNPYNESINTIFSFYERIGYSKNGNDNIKSYTQEEDKRILCLMVDLEELEKGRNNYLKTIVSGSKFWQPEIIRNSDFTFTNNRTGEKYDFYLINF